MRGSNEAEDSFHCFPDLYPELRYQIWRHTPALFPRIIEVRPCTTPTEAWDPITTKHHVRVTAPIVLLQINREARELLLPYYTLLSSDVTFTPISHYHLASPNPHEKPPMVNFDTDTLYFSVAWSTTEKIPYLSFIQRLFQNFDQDKQRVRRVAVDNSSKLSNLIDFPFKLRQSASGEHGITNIPPLQRSEDSSPEQMKSNGGEYDAKDPTEFSLNSRHCNERQAASETCLLDMKSALLEFKNLDELVIVVRPTHLRADVVLVCFVDLGNASIGEEEECIDIPRILGSGGWKIPKIRICTTHVVPVDNRRMESQRAYLERVYGKAFVSSFTRE
ncbi:uncharacterized protein EAF01_004254 [Botrytis porri]|uniref:2EXR domain-containing protein n=1 Tax=Botrytis porri TaxID=87229 RepID=A0A4Z1KDT9_9HELO|nr:uncharacterized protein EAF01_004254 [Botrytis porri]KAF7908499.1 hypothetical protein EAF01_004254 [Botrytis porri]TGO83556.1 hypothetical protein BPOR_0628g00060 [Botrytis porri]